MREITVLHLLWKSVGQGSEFFLLRPHAAWAADGRPLLAPLTKKVPAAADADAALQITLDALRREDLDVAPPLAHVRLRPAMSLPRHQLFINPGCRSTLGHHRS